MPASESARQATLAQQSADMAPTANSTRKDGVRSDTTVVWTGQSHARLGGAAHGSAGASAASFTQIHRPHSSGDRTEMSLPGTRPWTS